ncbi:MAG: hypothetical protein ACI9O0_000532 [Paracoccaceae bacterium]|jgi:uncharacterized protein YjiS (DUF1127 family)
MKVQKITMINALSKIFFVSQQAAAVVKILDQLSDHLLADLGHTRAIFVQEVKNKFIASLNRETPAKFY